MRINGHAAVSTDAALLKRLCEAGKTAKTAVTVHIDEVLFHCGKAINRARLWEPESRLERRALPSIGQMKAAISGASDDQARALDEQYTQSVRTNLY